MYKVYFSLSALVNTLSRYSDSPIVLWRPLWDQLVDEEESKGMPTLKVVSYSIDMLVHVCTCMVTLHVFFPQTS